MNHFQLNFYSSILISSAWIGVLAIVVGAPLLRLRSHYFIMGTFITAEVTYLLMEQANFFGLHGASPVQLPIPVVGDPRAFDRYFYFISLGFVVFAAAVIVGVRSTRMGLALRAIGQDEGTAAALGVANVRYKLLAFGISSAIIALAGGVNAYWVGYLAQSTAFSLLITIKGIVMAVTGGIGLVAGAAVGATVIQAIEQIAGPNLAQLSQLVYGILVIAIVVALPAGLVPGIRGIVSRLVRRRRLD